MYDTQEIYLSRLEPQEEIVTCPKCGSELTALKFIFSERGLSPINRTYTCLKCQMDFKINPLADDDSIPF